VIRTVPIRAGAGATILPVKGLTADIPAAPAKSPLKAM